eukprot:CAMPEP_0201144002 /NCGR_PEP_ID=MMETSP0851-20130426/5755_1 /ASSEMBLY_ACC=CAM_ASM_000631 /TAXON_ID=183588 /ORGANISM="Pseudo-nitzschia fraudulenta, Strain WWA7" /LENGTH=87 /DNA_ID=CAMNT_0047418535 /DNA_START=184 /DNA_END=447 /DNA_ORIENTATION=-
MSPIGEVWCRCHQEKSSKFRPECPGRSRDRNRLGSRGKPMPGGCTGLPTVATRKIVTPVRQTAGPVGQRPNHPTAVIGSKLPTICAE